MHRIPRLPTLAREGSAARTKLRLRQCRFAPPAAVGHCQPYGTRMSEKTEQPTDKKLEDSRRKGQSPKSPDLVFLVTLVAGVLVLMGGGTALFDQLSHVLRLALVQGPRAHGMEDLLALGTDMLRTGFLATLPLVTATVVMAVVALLGQVGFRVSAEAVEPKFEKVDPGQGFKRLINVRSVMELVKAVIKAAVLGSVLWLMVRSLVPAVVGAAWLPLAGAAAVAWEALMKLLCAAIGVFVVFGPLDFALQRWLFVRDNKMSKDEIKREYKEDEGDPYLNAHLRSLQHEMATSAPQQRVPGATVVVTNPTHYAVALVYREGVTPLPVVVAKGVDEAAAVIRALAREHGVPIVANPPLARALHKLPIDTNVPEELLASVATVLNWVAQMKSAGTST
jgi:type III secretion protein U